MVVLFEGFVIDYFKKYLFEINGVDVLVLEDRFSREIRFFNYYYII